MFEIHFANRIEALTDQLVGRLGAARRDASIAAPFVEDQVVVPSAAIERHLTLSIAGGHGICANVRFSYLARWLWQRIGALVPGVAAESPYDARVMAWRVYVAFGDEHWIAGHQRLAAWLADADPAMRLALATRVAMLLEQMIVYRPDWLAAWAEGRRAPIGHPSASAMADEAWQAALWRRVVDAVGQAVSDPVADFRRALRQAGAGDGDAAALPDAVHVFCLPAIPPLHLDLLHALSRRVDVHVYALNPCREYWFDTVDRRRLAWLAASGRAEHREEGHRLLAGWGRQAQAQLSLLVDAVGETVVDDADFVACERPTLLGRLQDSILALADLEPGSAGAVADDDSIEIHVCHSPTREIEVLHDRLLACFSAPDAPMPGDILVVTPDIDAAAPLIHAVFGTAPADRRIPYAITGLAPSAVNPAARALLDLLALADSRFTASAVFGLLQQPMVARRFGLDTDALELARAWLQSAGVHWALDATHREQCDMPGSGRHSFADGLDRLYLGYALPSGFGAPFAGRMPVGDAEGADASTLGAISHVVDSLSTLQRTLARPLPAREWAARLVDTLADFIATDVDALDDLREVQDAVADWASTIERSGIGGTLPLAVVRASLDAGLAAQARGGVPSGAVTFASMSSLRNLPFRQVCAIGLNDGAFPGSTPVDELDLIALAPRPGDRQRRVDERNVFLDLILAARERLYLSHVGRNLRDNARLPPSVLVSELLEYLAPAIAGPGADATELAAARARLVVEHPLQPFSEQAFRHDADPRVRSFNREYAAALKSSLAAASAPAPFSAPAPDIDDDPGHAADAVDDDPRDDLDDDAQDARGTSVFFTDALPDPGAAWRDLSAERLARFFRNPSRFLIEQRLSLALPREEDEWLDDEPLVATARARARLAARLVPHALAGAPREAVAALARAGTELPSGVFGERMLARELDGIDEFAQRARDTLRAPCVAPHTATLAIVADGRTWRLSAGFADLRADGLVRHRYGNARARDFLDAWISHLVLNAAPPPGVAPRTCVHLRDGDVRLRPVADPRGVLATLLGLYDQGLRAPLPFFPRAAWALVRKKDNLALAKREWMGSMRGFAEREDVAHRLAWRGRPDPLEHRLEAFVHLAHEVFDPLLEHLEGDAP
ncbi:MAG: exodeoxyribonuclease V subunit gamma [Lautropia sp.]